jgi:hypothetical protein
MLVSTLPSSRSPFETIDVEVVSDGITPIQDARVLQLNVMTNKLRVDLTDRDSALVLILNRVYTGTDITDWR